MSDTPHIADKESKIVIVSISPDFCIVGESVVPFDIARSVVNEQKRYATTVRARGERVLLVSSVVDGVEGNAGKGIISGVSLDQGCSKIITGSSTVLAEDAKVARHNDLCVMNGRF